jgi:hypothetical protein
LVSATQAVTWVQQFSFEQSVQAVSLLVGVQSMLPEELDAAAELLDAPTPELLDEAPGPELLDEAPGPELLLDVPSPELLDVPELLVVPGPAVPEEDVVAGPLVAPPIPAAVEVLPPPVPAPKVMSPFPPQPAAAAPPTASEPTRKPSTTFCMRHKNPFSRRCPPRPCASGGRNAAGIWRGHLIARGHGR